MTITSRDLPALFALLLGVVAGCSPSSSSLPDMAFVTTDPLILARPYDSTVPAGYDPARPAPLVISLHGHGGTPFIQEAFFRLGSIADSAGFLLAVPLGELGDDKTPQWRCCSDDDTDVRYLDAVIADLSARYRVDPRRIFVTGHSQGAAMSYRYACERSGKIAGVVPVSGTWSTDPAKCAPTGPISVLGVYGTVDSGYGPQVRANVAFFAEHDGCDAKSDTTAPRIDLDTVLPGADTTVEKWSRGCRSGTAAELWVVEGAAHVPHFQPDWPNRIWNWMVAHPK